MAVGLELDDIWGHLQPKPFYDSETSLDWMAIEKLKLGEQNLVPGASSLGKPLEANIHKWIKVIMHPLVVQRKGYIKKQVRQIRQWWFLYLLSAASVHWAPGEPLQKLKAAFAPLLCPPGSAVTGNHLPSFTANSISRHKAWLPWRDMIHLPSQCLNCLCIFQLLNSIEIAERNDRGLK